MINFQGVRGGVGYNDTASDQDSRRRQQLAQLMLQQSNAAPAVGWTGALNKILSGAIAGYQMGKDSEEQKARGDAKNDTLARALSAGQGQAAETKSYGDGTTINWDERKGDPNRMAAILAGNRDTAPMGMQMQIGQMDNKAKAEADLARALRERDERRADAQYTHGLNLERDAAKGYDLGDGRRFFPDAPGGEQPPQAPGGGVDMRTASAAPNPPPVERQPMSHTPGYAVQVKGLENGTGNPNAKNPNSSATGDGQFINATWLDLMKRNRPDIVQGKSDQDILALRADPKLSAEMTDVYGMENADALRAGGIQNVGNAEKYAAHFFGPTGAIKVLQADPNASFASVLSPEVIKANPQLARMTVGQWRQQNAAKFSGGGEQPQPRVQVADASGAIPAGVPAPGAQRTTIGGRSGTVIGGDGGDAGPYGGPTLQAQDRNTVYTFEQKMMNGEKLTPQEQWRYETSKRALEAPHTFVGPEGVTTSTPSTMPSMRQPAPAATDAVPNPLQPGSPAAVEPPAPRSNQPTITVVQKKTEKPSNEQNLNAGFANRLNASNGIFDSLETEGYVNPSLKDRAASHVPVIGGYLESNNFQKMDQAQREFINAQLRRESGAAISDGEFENARRQYFPQPGDGPDVLAQKRTSREMALANMAQSAGPAELGFKPKPAPKAGDKPATPTTIMRFDAEGNIVQ